jgi:dihydroorotate dehydrogenase
MSAEDAVSKIKAGANVVQIYTGLIYKGPALVTEAAIAIKKSCQGSNYGGHVLSNK